LVGVFEAFNEDVASEGESSHKTDTERKKEFFHGCYICGKNIKIQPNSLDIPKKALSLKRFLKHLIIDMPNVVGNMVYLNIKERDRF
jgi:hypothetical protein